MVVKQGKEIGKILYQGKRVTDIYKQGEILFPNMRGLMPDTKNSIIDTLGTDAWMQTLDYVRQKPELVPFINEDPMLACSLVDTGKVRWMYTNDSGRFVTNILVNDFDEFDSICKLNKKGCDLPELFGASMSKTAGADNSKVVRIAIDENTAGNVVYNNKWTDNVFFLDDNQKTHIYGYLKPGMQKIYVNGVVSLNKADTSTLINNTYLSIYDMSYNGVFNGHKGLVLSYLKFLNSSELIAHFVPFKRNGEMELLDLVTFTLASRVGTFTETIE